MNKKIEKYLKECEHIEGLALATMKGKKRVFKRLLKFLKNKELTIETTKDYIYDLREKGWDRGTNSELKVIKSFVSWLFKNEYTEENWGKKVSYRKLPRKERTLADTRTLLKIITLGCKPSGGDNVLTRAKKKDYFEALQVFIIYGMRVGGLVEMRRENINLFENEFSFKTKGDLQTKRIMPHLLPIFKKRSEGKGKVFEINEKTINARIRQGCNALGIKNDFTAHSVRHSVARNAIREDIPMPIIQKMLGHKKISTTIDIYGNIDNSDEERGFKRNILVREAMPRKERIEATIEKIKRDTPINGFEIKKKETWVRLAI